MMNILLIIASNLVLYIILRIHLVRKFRSGYSISLKDGEGNRQQLQATIAYLLEQAEISDEKVMYVAKEMENQWLEIEKMKMITGSDKYNS